MAKRVPQIKDLIDELGGGQTVAAELNKLRPEKTITRDDVYQWKCKNTVPFRWRPLLAQLVAARKLPVPPELMQFAPAGRSAAE